MSRFGVFTGTVAMLGLVAGAAWQSASAKEVSISGKHSQADVRAACKASADAGNDSVSFETGKGYGCINKTAGTQVTCNWDGKCEGDVPGRTAPPGNRFDNVRAVVTGASGAGSGNPLGPGLLDAGAGFAVQGPAATGSPAGAAPAAPPVQLR